MLDKILGKKRENENDSPPDLRGKKKDDSDLGGRLKNLVGKVTKREGKGDKEEEKAPAEDKPKIPKRRIPKPMPRPKEKPEEKPRLRVPPKKPDSKKPRQFGRRVPPEDRRTLVGAAVFGLILIILVGAGYYFLVYQPYQETLQNAKTTKLNELQSYFKGPLATDPRKQALLAEIDGAVTPEEALVVDVLGPATGAWRQYQNQQISTKKDPYGRVMITYAAAGQKNVIIKVADAQRLVNQADASVLANMEIKTPDTVVVPIILTRLQAAGGLINVGNSVDVYQKTNATNQTTTANATPNISGATVLAILRARESGTVTANMSHAQSIAFNEMAISRSDTQSANKDVEQLLRAAASRNWDEAQINALLQAYGWRLSDFERVSNLGELDVKYLVLLEVPRENALWLINQPSDSIILTVPTQQAPDWMIKELTAIYK